MEEERTSLLVCLGSSHHSLCQGPKPMHWGRQTSEDTAPPAVSALSLCVGGGGEGLASLVIKSFLCHRDPSPLPGCGVVV